jgi:hypothetical protein
MDCLAVGMLKETRCGSSTGLLGQNGQTHHRMEPEKSGTKTDPETEVLPTKST